MPTKTSVGPNEVVRLGVLRLTPPLTKRYTLFPPVCRSPVCVENAKEQREARGCYRPTKRLRREGSEQEKQRVPAHSLCSLRFLGLLGAPSYKLATPRGAR
jgi:hypothetical protein